MKDNNAKNIKTCKEDLIPYIRIISEQPDDQWLRYCYKAKEYCDYTKREELFYMEGRVNIKLLLCSPETFLCHLWERYKKATKESSEEWKKMDMKRGLE